jgi:uncharacterized protein YkwD
MQTRVQKFGLWLATVLFIAGSYWLFTFMAGAMTPYTSVLSSLEAEAPWRFLQNKNLPEILSVLAPEKTANYYAKRHENPSKLATRLELVRASCTIGDWPTSPVFENPFKDISRFNRVAPCIAYARDNGFLNAFNDIAANNRFGSTRSIRRGETGLFLQAAFKEIKIPAELRGTPDEVLSKPTPVATPTATPALATPALATPTPVTPILLSKTFFKTVTLTENLPNTFYKDELFIVRGTALTNNIDTVFAFLIPENGKNQIHYFGTLNSNGSFEIPISMPVAGNYKIGIIAGRSGESLVAEISVLNRPPNKDNSLSEAPQAATSLAASYKDGETSLSWTVSDNSTNFVRITFKQKAEQKRYIIRGTNRSIKIHVRDFAGFQHDAVGTISIETAKAKLTEEILQNSSWSNPVMIQKTFAERGFRTLDERVSPSLFEEYIPQTGLIKFKGTSSVELSNEGAITRPNGTVDRFIIKETSNDTIPPHEEFFAIATAKEKGRYIFELNDPHGAAVVNVPVFVGEEYLPIIPDFFDLNSNVTTSEAPIDMVASQKEMLALINQARRDHGLGTVVLNNELSALSQEHSNDMLRRNFFSHVNPDKESPEDRRKKLGIATPVRENLAKSPTVRFGHEGLMRSPVHRSTILTSGSTRVGIGIAKMRDGTLLITQEFASDPLTVFDLTEKKRFLIEHANELRGQRGMASFTEDAALSDVAVAWSTRMITDAFFGFTAPNGTQLVDTIRAAGINNGLQSFILQSNDSDNIVTSIDDHAPIIDGAYTSLGIGIAVDNLGILNITVLYRK